LNPRPPKKKKKKKKKRRPMPSVMRKPIRRTALLVLGSILLFAAGYWTGHKNRAVVFADGPIHGTIPKSYGRLAAAIADQIGTGMIFEDKDGVIRFVSVTGMKEGELARY
jgi:hypothetical protein